MSEEKTQVQNERKDLDILNKMKNLPGGLVIIPLVIAVVLATFVPQVFQIGGYVTALFYEGNACMMGFFLIVCGSMIDIKQVGMPLYKGVIMTGTKFLLGAADDPPGETPPRSSPPPCSRAGHSRSRRLPGRTDG